MKRCLVYLLFILSFQAQADGNSLLAGCQIFERTDSQNSTMTASEALKVGQCLGAVEGVRNTYLGFNSSLPDYMKFCPPAGGITNGQGIRIALKYLRENPEKLHEDQTLLLIFSLKKAFPCK